MKKVILVSAMAAGLSGIGLSANAEPVGAVGVEMICPATGPGAAVCVPAAVVLHELVKLLNGEDAFGPNGEVMKVFAAPIEIIDGNIKGAERESGAIDKALRATTGISLKDIERYGLFGGPNSIFRKPFG